MTSTSTIYYFFFADTLSKYILIGGNIPMIHSQIPPDSDSRQRWSAFHTGRVGSGCATCIMFVATVLFGNSRVSLKSELSHRHLLACRHVSTVAAAEPTAAEPSLNASAPFLGHFSRCPWKTYTRIAPPPQTRCNHEPDTLENIRTETQVLGGTLAIWFAPSAQGRAPALA